MCLLHTTFLFFKPLEIQNLNRKKWGEHIPRVPHQIAPMLVTQKHFLNQRNFKDSLALTDANKITHIIRQLKMKHYCRSYHILSIFLKLANCCHLKGLLNSSVDVLMRCFLWFSQNCRHRSSSKNSKFTILITLQAYFYSPYKGLHCPKCLKNINISMSLL